jgi:LysM repeat protein
MQKSEGLFRAKMLARRCVVGCLVCLIMVSPTWQVSSVALGAPESADSTTYVVAWGDSLSTIARRYGTTVAELVQANNVGNPDLIYVGQRLVIPGTTSPAPAGSGTHVVQRGDTLSHIAARHGTTVQQLVQMNGLTNPNLIYVGQRLAVPQSGAIPSIDGVVYRVQRGDTLIGIATRFRVSMWDIVLANNIANPSLIYVGQSLTIPGASSPGGSTPTALPTATPVMTPTSSPAPTDTATPRPPTSTPRPPTATPADHTPTPAPSLEFRYLQGSMRAFPNCGTVYFKGKITGVGGEPVNGRTVRLRFSGNVSYKVSGEGENPGEWGFAPLASEHYHSPFTFLIDIVESQGNPVPQSDTVEIGFTDCGTAGQFENVVFEYARGNPAPTSTATSMPTHNPAPTSTTGGNTPPPVDWDQRLNLLPCVRLVTVAERGIQLRPGDRYWRLVRARWLNEEESRRDIQIHVDLLDEAGQRVFGDTVVFQDGGTTRVISERQDCCYPWDYPVKCPMYNVLCSYSAYVEGLPSDVVAGMGLGTPEHPDWTIHTGFILTFQRTVYQ